MPSRTLAEGKNNAGFPGREREYPAGSYASPCAESVDLDLQHHSQDSGSSKVDIGHGGLGAHHDKAIVKRGYHECTKFPNEVQLATLRARRSGVHGDSMERVFLLFIESESLL
jgi:hypothetical protein